ncbi:MAG TPA: alpha/beta hydrolase [Miltoncostaeaceae bacterium]|jgi:pimeloyl-ACP methyl ester carboxylesterase|nr:alpha/beta hydrolase [Miltoncostaeaceae bacterium]
MATYALIHGAGDVGWYWHLVAADLRARGHDVVAPDLPCEDESAGLADYADVVLEAIGDRDGVVVVAQSFGGYTAPIVCAQASAKLLVLVAGMVPRPGETAAEMFASTGYAEALADAGGPDAAEDPVAVFYHDVPPALAAEALRRGRDQAQGPGAEPYPLAAWPDVPTRYLLCRDDRLFPAAWSRRVARERLGLEPDEIAGGHCPALSRPGELAGRLEAYRRPGAQSERWDRTLTTVPLGSRSMKRRTPHSSSRRG